MAKYRVTSPSGQSYEITAPDNASQEDVLKYAQSQFQAQEQPVQSARDKFLATLPPERRAAAEAYQQGKSMPVAIAQASAEMSPASNALVKYATNYANIPRTIKQIFSPSQQQPFQGSAADTIFGIKGSDIDAINAAIQQEHPIAGITGDLAAGLSQLYLGAKALPMGTITKTMPVLANPYVANPIIGAGMGAMDMGTPEQRLTNAGIGSLGGLLGTAGGDLLSYGFGKAKNLAQNIYRIGKTALSEQGAKQAAGRILAEAAGGPSVSPQQATVASQNIDDIINALKQAKPGESAGQAAVQTGNAPFVAMQKLADTQFPSEAVARQNAQEAARMNLLKSVTPDVNAAIAARGEATTPLYQQAENKLVTVTPKIQELFSRMPKGTLERAADIARMDNRPFLIGENKPASNIGIGILDASGNEITKFVPAENQKITGESLHYIKRALSDIANGKVPEISVKSDAQKSAIGVLNDFLSTIESEKYNPLYGEARRRYAQMSVPVNQGNVLEAMQAELAKPGGGERIGPFLNVLGKGEQSLLKRSTGFPRFDNLQEVLSQPQMGAVQDVANQLTRDATEKQLATAGLPKALEIMKMGEMKGAVGPSLIDQKISAVNWILRQLEGKGGQKVNETIGKLMQPENINELITVMQAAKPNVRAKLLAEAAKRNIRLGSGLTSAILAPQWGQNQYPEPSP